MNDPGSTYHPQLKDKVFRLALRLLEDYEGARDIVQDVFVKVWGRREIIEQYKHPEALIIKIARDLCLDRLKQQKVRREKLAYWARRKEALNQNISYDDKQLGDLARQMIARLPVKQKVIIHLRDVEGYEFEEMSEILEMEVGAIRMNLSRARKTVREQLLKMMSHGI